uniref:Uncharacterized protein n=1 Tax=Rhizophora mucronata TaxID=61149 RepID=A0A2P2P2F7_RHIMU
MLGNIPIKKNVTQHCNNSQE